MGGKRRGGGGGDRRGNKERKVEGARRENGAGEWRYEKGKSDFRSPMFEAFYAAQGIVPPAEWDAFIAIQSSPLPVTFRINPLAPEAANARASLGTEQWSKPFVMDDGRVVDAPRALSWLPEAWQLGYGKPDLRRNANLKSFHEWLQVMNADGVVSRQEAVSMIPPLLLDVQPHHQVLDMCAAPGSKTAQLLEHMHAGEMAGQAPPSGMVVANDSDSKRAYLLTHQCARIGSPNLIVTCHDAQLFPNLAKRGPGAGAGDEGVTASGGGCFDRVLADVPCSGDGTGRKNLDAIFKWTPQNGMSLHPLQVQITMRGLALLRPGGVLVYSTCSLNPVEDEAVVAEVLRRCGGAVELEDVSFRLPALKRLPGLTTWRVADREGAWIESYETAMALNEAGHVSQAARKLLASQFPPSPEVASSYHLERCMRVTPHLQDTGGFFICALRKTRALPAAAMGGGNHAKAGAAGAGAAPRSGKRLQEKSHPSYDGRYPAEAAAAAEASEAAAEAQAAAEVAAEAAAAAAEAIAAAAAVEEEGEEEGEGEGAGEGASAPAPTPAPAAAGIWKAPWKKAPKAEAGVGDGGKAVGVERDSKGRPLVGRLEMTTYTRVNSTAEGAVIEAYGLRPDFPRHLLYTRAIEGAAAGSMVLMSPPIAAIVLPLQKSGSGEGKVKVVNSGIKVLAENRDRIKDPANQKDAGTRGPEDAPSVGIPGVCDYRLLQEGLLMILPFLRARVVHASGAEIATIMHFRGSFAPATLYSARLGKCLAALPPGSFALVLNPALDGRENEGEGSGPRVEDTVDVVGASGAWVPKDVVPLASAAAIAPALRAHYVTVDGSANLTFSPGARVWTGASPLARAALCMWKGRARYNVMLHATEAAGLLSTLASCGYAAVPELTEAQKEAVASLPVKPATVQKPHFDGRNAGKPVDANGWRIGTGSDRGAGAEAAGYGAGAEAMDESSGQ